MQQIEFRSMLETDLDAVMRVEQKAYDFPWAKGLFADCLRAGYDCTVAWDGVEIIAHAILSSAAGESHILNLTVCQSCQRQGIGKQLLRHLIDKASLKSSDMILLEVRRGNQGAIHLYEAAGFNEIGCRKDYYPAPNGKEDALLLAMQL